MTDLAFEPAIQSLFHTIELDLGQSAEVQLDDDHSVRIELIDITSEADNMRKAFRKSVATVKINDQTIKLTSANYNLPVAVENIKIDCPITKDYLSNNRAGNVWALAADARFRIWPGDSPLTVPDTFGYPARQKWFATATQIGNEPTWVDGGENPSNTAIYYHSGVDIGGADQLTEIVSATDGLVVSAGGQTIPGIPEDNPVRPRYDLVYILDGRGWYYRYSHLDSIDPSVKPGHPIRLGDPVGILGKEGASGGWSHLHFEALSRQPNGQWGTQSTYALLFEAYRKQYDCQLFACVRPHHSVLIDHPVILDATRSWARVGITRYQWQFSDGSTADIPRIEKRYDTPGLYCETLEISDAAGNEDYDFACVYVTDLSNPDQLAPSIHATYHPTMNLKAGQPITFLVRTFNTTRGRETWDFDDGSDPVTVHSDGNVDHHAKDGYACVQHTFDKPGRYFVSVSTTNEHKFTATAKLYVDIK